MLLLDSLLNSSLETLQDDLEKFSSNNFDTNRISMTFPYTCPSNGKVWVAKSKSNYSMVYGINGTPSIAITPSMASVALKVNKGDVVSVMNGSDQDNCYFYPLIN